ncbi:MAG TPA: hypothetical protein VFQ54_11690 [Thermomicrobiales bacterium]|nr:hypothetical protein [Thermomicrobiales bacterium]
MTTRVYLAAVKFVDGSGQPGDLPAERVFVNASDVPEVWVETESTVVGDVGRRVAFLIARPMDIGFSRVTGTIERKLEK